MAAKGFIKLLELAERSRQHENMLQAGQQVEFWSGVGFKLHGTYFVAPMGEVSEVLSVPRYTHVPGAKPWIKGIANVRGRLLPIMDLLMFLNQTSALHDHVRRLMVIDHGDIFTGLVVDEIFGIQRFTEKEYSSEVAQMDRNFLPYVQGCFRRDEQQWAIFSLSRLVEAPQFLQAAKA